jgi:hypothetical protein
MTLIRYLMGCCLLLLSACSKGDRLRAYASLPDAVLTSLAAGTTGTTLQAFCTVPDASGTDAKTEADFLSGALRTILERLGNPRHARHGWPNPSTKYIGIGPGTGEYWGRFPRFGRDQTLGYAVEYDHAGSGWIRLHFFHGGSEPCLQSLDFSLEGNSPELEGARAALGRLLS